MNRYLSALRKIYEHPRPFRFVLSRLLLRLKIPLSATSTFSHDPLVMIALTANPIAHNAWLTSTEPIEVEIFKKYITAGSTVFDVGANVGTHALLAAKLAHAGHVYAFEPGANAYAALRKNIALNGVTNITSYNTAVSDGEAQWELVQPGRSDEQSFIVPATNTAPLLHTVRLEEVMSSHRIPHIDFLKIDVEGAELLVLRSLGERIADVHKIFFENIPRVMERFGYTQTELYEFLTGRGFTLHTIDHQDGEIVLTPITSLQNASANVLATRSAG